MLKFGSTTAEKGKTVSTMRSRRLRLGAVVAGLSLVIVVPALAGVAPWQPTLRGPADGPVATDDSPVSAAAVNSLAPLRRAQTDQDRSDAAPLLTQIGAGNQLDGVQTSGIRSLAPGHALVPVKSLKMGAGKTSQDMMCLAQQDSVACGRDAQIPSKGMVSVSASYTTTTFAGVVPDGVTGIEFTSESGSTVKTDVASNFFTLKVPEAGTSAPTPVPPGYTGTAKTMPGPPLPAKGELHWLNSSGKVVGPN